MSHRLRLPVAVTAAIGVALLIAGPASAHIHTDPEEVKAGTENTVGFVIEHGCDGSPTTKIELQLPDGVTGISAEDQDGFTASVDGQVVTFDGGTLPDGTEQAFAATFTAPTEAGTIDIPRVQTCEVGETSWIEPEVEGQPEPEYPAPQLVIAPNPDATTTTTAAETTTTGDAASTTATSAPAVTTTTAPATGSLGASEPDDSDNTPLLIAAAVVAIAIAGGVIYLLARKKDDADPTAGTGADPTDPTNPTGTGGTPTT
ncbi:MAG: YcnI family copper-binding membrane protein [Aquihabitans sp.]